MTIFRTKGRPDQGCGRFCIDIPRCRSLKLKILHAGKESVNGSRWPDLSAEPAWITSTFFYYARLVKPGAVMVAIEWQSWIFQA